MNSVSCSTNSFYCATGLQAARASLQLVNSFNTGLWYIPGNGNVLAEGLQRNLLWDKPNQVELLRLTNGIIQTPLPLQKGSTSSPVPFTWISTIGDSSALRFPSMWQRFLACRELSGTNREEHNRKPLLGF